MKRLAWCLLYGFAGLAQAAINDVTFHGTLVSPHVLFPYTPEEL